jgi:demethylmenaquinone methyltransferase/2-methoxy-6-polyprenyl-1,4-benzoquinol methylase
MTQNTDTQNKPTGPQPEFVKDIFSSIAGTYDKANDVITMGLARDWRKKLVSWSGAKAGQKVLDCATGTGDLALDFKRVVGPTGSVLGTDFCKEMLDYAPAKAQAADLEIQFEVADAMNLQYESKTFDITSISYGIRNVQKPETALTEMARVTRTGGHVMILETGVTRVPLLKSAIGLYFRHIVPRLGGWVSGKRSAYEYLNRSSLAFPSGEAFCQMMRSTGVFDIVEYKSIMGGASFIYKGRVK